MNTASFRVLLLGDMHFGENYKSAGARVLADRGYMGGLEHLQRFTAAADTVIANLETPLVDPAEHPSPMEGVRPYLHWAEPKQTVAALKSLGVDAVSLANNHMLDRGVSGLRTTLENLDHLGLQYFGAGLDLPSADAPFRVDLPQAVGAGQLSFQGSFTVERAKIDYGFYAEENVPGCAPLSEERVESLPVPHEPQDVFRVAFPHWGPNYKWRNNRQRRLARGLIRRGYDLVLGHGAHCLQEIERTQRHWAVYGIGNGHFQAGGRFKKMVKENNILPFSFWAMLHVEAEASGQRSPHLRLYPVYSDNTETGYAPSPVNEKDFNATVATIQGRGGNSHTFDNDHMSLGDDDLGHFIRLELGDWPVGRRPPRPPRNVTPAHPREETTPISPSTDPLVSS